LSANLGLETFATLTRLFRVLFSCVHEEEC
jgi:hypothetical protein